MKKIITTCLAAALSLASQPSALAAGAHGHKPISHQEALRGSITPERLWWDLRHYALAVTVDPTERTIGGTNTMTYRVLTPGHRLQIELQAPMQLHKVTQNGEELAVEQDGYSYFITPEKPHKVDQEYRLTMHFGGKPQEAKRPPWDGGITWKKDSNGLDFIASSNQGNGASIWWPNKDHPYDEPDDGALISVEVPEHLMDVSNGRLIKTENHPERKTKTYHWQVVNPINNYGINLNIGDYVHFGEKYQGEKGELDMDYYVLRENLKKAKVQFRDAKRTLAAFEYWFGPYPFYEDSFKLVEVPYLGMEHQSSVTYGNGYKNGYRGRDLSKTGWGLQFDFIIVHESGHEWFANNLTNKDVADMWIHESFTNYSEGLFLEYHYSEEAGAEYIRGMRAGIKNDSPLIGTYDANREGSGDMYNKGGNMLHTIRQLVDNDETWRNILRGLNKDFYHQVVTSKQVEEYISTKAGKDLSKVFDQYLRDARLPILEYVVQGKTIRIRWSNTVENFNMPIKVAIAGKEQWIKPTTSWSEVQNNIEQPSFVINKDFYVAGLNNLGN